MVYSINTMKLKSLLDGCSGQVWITLEATFIFPLFQPLPRDIFGLATSGVTDVSDLFFELIIWHSFWAEVFYSI